MIEGLRRAEQGMLPRVTQQETLANNLANSLTPGFKRDRVTFQAALRQAADGSTPGGAAAEGAGGATPGAAGGAMAPELPGGPSYELSPATRPDMRPGALEQTGNPLDVALSENAFFVIETPDGPRYTRAGSFTRNAAGELAMPDGARVLGENGPVRVDGAVSIASDGQVSVDGQVRDRLRVVRFASPETLRHQGNSLWTSSAAPVPAREARVQQGFVEGSNVNPVEEMIEMMNAFRSYEANLRSAQIQGDSLGQLINNVGRGR